MTSTSSSSSTWWKITLLPIQQLPVEQINDHLDELGYELIELGATSTAIQTPPEILAFFNGDKTAKDTYVSSINPQQLSVVDVLEVTDQNWNENCPEVWQPVHAKNLVVVPVSSADDPRPNPSSPAENPDQIFMRIIPGQGFGTGHHPTTRMILEELSLYQETDSKPVNRILDIGTGSGILAIAAAKLFNAPIDATDIDQDALNNASDNLNLNQVSSLVSLSLKDLPELNAPYEIILANVYGEVLVQMRDEITRLAAPGAQAFLSGVTELIKDLVIDSFIKNDDWSLVTERGERDWMCFVLKRAF